MSLIFDPSVLFQATGARGDAFRLTNRGPTTCRIAGYPVITLRDRRGGLLPFHYTDGQSPYITRRQPQPVTVRPGRWVYVGVAKYRCDVGISASATTLTMTLPGQGGVASVALSGRALRLDYCQGGRTDSGNTVAISPIEPAANRILN